MPRLKMVSLDTIIQANELITGNKCTEAAKGRLGGCLSSYFYYSSLQEQITSIVVNLVKDHYFLDGNKRTAFIIYVTLCELNNLTPVSGAEQQAAAFIEIAVTHKDISAYASLLFPS